MLIKLLHRGVAITAILGAIGCTTALYAQDQVDDLFETTLTESEPGCSSGTANPCRETSNTLTACSEYVVVGVNGNIGPLGGGIGGTLQCKVSKTITVKYKYYYAS